MPPHGGLKNDKVVPAGGFVTATSGVFVAVDEVTGECLGDARGGHYFSLLWQAAKGETLLLRTLDNAPLGRTL